MNKLLLTLLTAGILSAGTLDIARTEIMTSEGYSKYAYQEPYSNDKSIGYGFNLSNGVSRAEARVLLDFRLLEVKARLNKLAWYRRLSYRRKSVILSMAYNLGMPKLLKFKRLIWVLSNNRRYYHAAANAMRDSLWCKQVGNRCTRLSAIMWKGY